MKQETLPVLIQHFPETKKQITSIHTKGREFLLEGNLTDAEVLNFAARVNAMISLGELFKKDDLIKDLVLEAHTKYGEKSFTLGNATFRQQEVGVSYDFANCDDAELNELLAEAKELDTKIKARKEFLKTIKPDMEVYGRDGSRLNPPSKKSSTQVVITLK